MTVACVKLWNGTAGEGRERQVVWIVSVHLADGSEDPMHDWTVHSEEDDAEEDAAERGACLGLPVIDERDAPAPNVLPFVKPGSKR